MPTSLQVLICEVLDQLDALALSEDSTVRVGTVTAHAFMTQLRQEISAGEFSRFLAHFVPVFRRLERLHVDCELN